MKREVWPEDYKIPHWIDNLATGVPERKSSWWRGYWAGMLGVCSVAAILTIPNDEESTRRYINVESIFWVAFILSFIACAGFMVTRCSLSASLDVDPDDEIWLKVLREKARADSYTKQWTPQESQELQNCWKWSVNNSENNADKKYEERQKHWLKRRFMRDRPKSFILPVTKYYGELLREIGERRIEVQAKEREAAQNFEWSVELQFDAAVRQNVILDKRYKGLLPPFERRSHAHDSAPM